jgi:hypothetical protein
MGYRESVAMLLDYIVLLFNEYFTIQMIPIYRDVEIIQKDIIEKIK